jgi:SAM-dependent methyltransferase
MRPFDVVLRVRGYMPMGIDPTAPAADCLGSLPHLPFRDEAFPLVLCINVLQYVDDPLRACRELHRIVRTDGSVLVVVPHCLPLGPSDYWRWTEYAARRMLIDSGFEDVEVVPILPTVSIQFHLFALSARKAVPIFGRVVAVGLDLIALAALRSRNASLTGGYALRARKRDVAERQGLTRRGEARRSSLGELRPAQRSEKVRGRPDFKDEGGGPGTSYSLGGNPY